VDVLLKDLANIDDGSLIRIEPRLFFSIRQHTSAYDNKDLANMNDGSLIHIEPPTCYSTHFSIYIFSMYIYAI
jgi:hypothetical protein